MKQKNELMLFQFWRTTCKTLPNQWSISSACYRLIDVDFRLLLCLGVFFSSVSNLSLTRKLLWRLLYRSFCFTSLFGARHFAPLTGFPDWFLHGLVNNSVFVGLGVLSSRF